MGFWMAANPQLHLVRMGQYSAWCDYWRHVGDLRSLLVAHRAPWDQYMWLQHHIEALWAAGTHLTARHHCSGPPCASSDCGHAEGQRACAIEVSLARAPGQPDVGCRQCSCWAQMPGSARISRSGGSCNKGYWVGEPSLRRDCRPFDSTQE